MDKRKCYASIVDRVVAALKVTKVDFGKKIGVSKSVINSWRITGIPPKYCNLIERMLSGTEDPMTRKDLRPFDWKDKFPELKFSDHKKVA
mgnify:CR=1 FL=1